MAINQLFKIKPSYDILTKLCLLFNIDLNNLDKNNNFTINELNFDINDIKKLLEHCYLKCKQKIYFNDISMKKSITILRQILRLYNYNLISTDYYNNSKKYIRYTIKLNKNNINKKNNGIILFD
jgi:hypothetical protein